MEAQMATIKIFVIDAHPIIRQGLTTILEQYTEFRIVGDADSSTEALAKIEGLQPDIVIIDAFVPGGEGSEAITRLKEKQPQLKVLILTDINSEDNFLKAIKAGANGYLLKSVEPTELIETICLVTRGSAVVYSPMVVKLFEQSMRGNGKNGGNGLSHREVEILQLVAQGDSTKEIADQCFVSQTTVKAHLRRIAEKLEAKNRAQAVAIGIEKGILNHQ
jgi:DNA-binding NarL/FixJ family response regulator